MNPDKLFDYLEGKLPHSERARLEKQIAEDPQLQKEFAAAHRIHSNRRSESREILVQDDAASTERGRKMALRIGIGFLVLMALNVGGGLWFIARHEASNPNHKLLQQQAREQMLESARRAASALTASPLALDITVPAAAGQLERVAAQVVGTAQRLGGSATTGLRDGPRIGVLVDVPGPRESEFRAAITALPGSSSGSASPNDPVAAGLDKKSFVVHVIESASP